jgi:hypothetical protein
MPQDALLRVGVIEDKGLRGLRARSWRRAIGNPGLAVSGVGGFGELGYSALGVGM